MGRLGDVGGGVATGLLIIFLGGRGAFLWKTEIVGAAGGRRELWVGGTRVGCVKGFEGIERGLDAA